MAEKSISELLNGILDINPKIKFNDAKDYINDKYQKDLTRSNYDKIKCVRNKKNKGKKKSTGSNAAEPVSVTPGDVGVSSNLAMSPQLSTSKKLTAEYIESLIIINLDEDPKNTQMVGKAIDFFLRVKSGEGDEISELDLSKFLKEGISI